MMHGQVAVVIGGAGAIGSAICRQFARAGARCVVTYERRELEAEDVVRSLEGQGHFAAQVSVEDSASLHRLARLVGHTHRTIDVLVNCASITRFVPHDDLDGLDDELIDRIFAVNWRGSFAAIRVFRSALAAGSGGVVINVSSLAGTTAMGSNVAYCASKAAVDSMTKALARALAPAIRVVSLAPGLLDTDFVKGIDTGWREAQVARTPLGRLATPDEVGAAALAVVTHFPYSTGCVFPVDGGRALA